VNSVTRIVPDADVRRRALEPDCSFLVQAPAGSGKTELLIQRYLRLLAIVDEPEEILAITFTRKAAAEMQARVLRALAMARNEVKPADEHLLVGYELAVQAIERDRIRNWRIHEHTSRLRISTIDTVNGWLSRRAPLSAGFTSSHDVTEDAEPLLREAARRTIGLAEERDSVGNAVTQLLAHCDNRADRLESLLAKMLARRDQWMRQTGAGPGPRTDRLRRQLEDTLAELVTNCLSEARALISDNHATIITDVLNYAGCSISVDQPTSPLAAWQDLERFPDAAATALSLWRAMANAFLTARGEWRRRLTRKQGFPPDGKQMKARANDLLESFGSNPELELALKQVRQLPDPIYKDAQWAVLEHLLTVLPLSAAILKQVFAESMQTDFTEIAQEALATLGAEDTTTELSLMLDYQIQHILLDEFQDTSRSQYDLLKSLTQGWQSDAGRTLFLVGDPMQSIYRFREAEVGLFLDAQEQGIGGLPLEFLRLTTNFRSDPAIVTWFNKVFELTLPDREDRIIGAVPFAPSHPFHEADPDAGVWWHVVPHGDRQGEGQKVLSIIETSRHQQPGESIGVLVRSRQHATAIAKQLRDAGIEFTGTDFEALEEQGVVQDLLALTRALTHAADRLAWLAVLRGPWCGLTLCDLQTLAGPDHKACIWDLVQSRSLLRQLSQDARVRLDRVRGPIRAGLARRGSVPLRDCVEAVWLDLGGPATVNDAAELEVATRYFEFLDTFDAGGDCIDSVELMERLRKHSVTSAGNNSDIQIMTMHKAKGLEFDTVILPGLGYRVRQADQPLLLWHELARTDVASPLVFAPIKGAGSDDDGIYELLWSFERRKDELEQDRLLYVATTRARKRLHLFAQLARQQDSIEIAEPDPGSLLKRVWPAVHGDIEVGADRTLPLRTRTSTADRIPDWFETRVRRLAIDWQLPPTPAASRASPAVSIAEREEVEFDWATRTAMHIGSVVHLWLQQIGNEGSEQYDCERISQLRSEFRRMLLALGTVDDQLDHAVERVETALTNALNDEQGRWVLSGQHVESANEFPLTARRGNEFDHLVLDRTFVCKRGERWIVDYKTSTHEGGNLDEFLRSETTRYKHKLLQYRDAMARQDDRPIRTALYFPLLKLLHEVQVDS